MPDSGLSLVIGPGPGKWTSSHSLIEWILAKGLVVKKRDAFSLGSLLVEKGHLVPENPSGTYSLIKTRRIKSVGQRRLISFLMCSP